MRDDAEAHIVKADLVIEAVRLDFVSNDSTLSTPTTKVALDWTASVDLEADDAAFDADEVVAQANESLAGLKQRANWS